MKNYLKKIVFVILVCNVLFISCSKDDQVDIEMEEEVYTPSNFPYIFGKKPTEGKEIYISKDFYNNDFDGGIGELKYQRSASSDNIIVFWERGFGKDPSIAANVDMRVSIKKLLETAEENFAYYRDVMKFVTKDESLSEDYRMIIRLFYQEDWLATGWGFDDVIGALSINPGAASFDNVVAHEIGNAFQYQVKCDGYPAGFRSVNKVSFWEQCAQFMAWQQYPRDFFNDLPIFLENTHKHVSHEDFRYQSMYIMEYRKERHGVDFLGKVWKANLPEEHPLATYMRITEISLDEFNDEYFEYARKNIIWDYPLGNYNRNYVKALPKIEQNRFKHKTKLNAIAEDYYQIAPEQTPQNHGYNAIALTIPDLNTSLV